MGVEGDSRDTATVGSGDSEATVQELATIHIRCSNSSKFSVQTALDSTVGSFKVLLSQNCDLSTDQQRLIYKGRILKDDQTLESYGLQADHTVHMVRGSTPLNTSVPARSAGTADVASNPTHTTPLSEGGFPEFEHVQQQLSQDPNMMREMMNMPAIQSLMDNPELMRSLIMSNPQMREIIDRNPELGHVLNDPTILRQTLETTRNPELMREMMRNTDRVMSNIESSPEGFNMLRRMYENVQEPLLNATTLSANNNSNPFSALSATDSNAAPTVPNANPLPNPWGAQTNSAPRSNTGPADLEQLLYGGGGGRGAGGGGAPDPDPALFTQLLQNPAVSQMMQSLLSNPQYMDQILNTNPQLRAMSESNPQFREMMRNPDLLRAISSAEILQQMMTLQQNVPQSNQVPSQTGGAAGNNMNLDMLMNMLGGLGTGGAMGAPDVAPEELYATQLSQLQDMGFFDTQENIRALQATRGNVHAAVDRLLGSL